MSYTYDHEEFVPGYEESVLKESSNPLKDDAIILAVDLGWLIYVMRSNDGYAKIKILDLDGNGFFTPEEPEDRAWGYALAILEKEDRRRKRVGRIWGNWVSVV
jgi:hypothetical protein